MVVSTNVKTSTEAVTKEQSKNMLKNAIRTGISSIAYLRNLFDEEAFDESSVSGLQLKTLKPYNSEAKLILDWLNLGVIDALEKEYLRLLVFGIHNENDDLIECYHFKFKYGDKGSNINVSFCGNTSKAKSVTCKSHPCTKEEAKQQLWYYDEQVPKEYEPTLFRPATMDEQLKFSEVPFECSIGKVDTGHHTLSIRVKSTADEDMDYEGVEVNEVNNYLATNGEVCAPSQEVLEDKCKDVRFKGDVTFIEAADDSIPNQLCTDKGNQSVNDIKDSNASPECNDPNNENEILREEINSLLADATKLAKTTKYVKKETLASGLGIDVIVAKPLINRLIEQDVICNKLVRGKGYESKVYIPHKQRQSKRCREENDEKEDDTETRLKTLCYTSEQLTIPTKISAGANKTRRSNRRAS